MVSTLLNILYSPSLTYSIDLKHQSHALGSQLKRMRTQEKLKAEKGTQVRILGLRNEDYFMGSTNLEDIFG
jgi:hypothetical protein